MPQFPTCATSTKRKRKWVSCCSPCRICPISLPVIFQETWRLNMIMKSFHLVYVISWTPWYLGLCHPSNCGCSVVLFCCFCFCFCFFFVRSIAAFTRDPTKVIVRQSDPALLIKEWSATSVNAPAVKVWSRFLIRHFRTEHIQFGSGGWCASENALLHCVVTQCNWIVPDVMTSSVCFAVY